jgi:hypothetical protein
MLYPLALYPLVLSPEFLIKIENDSEARKKIKNFLIKYRDWLTDIFILIDDDRKNLQKEYDKIINEGEKNPISKAVVEEFKKLSLFGKVANIKTNQKNSAVNNILEELHNKKIKNIVQFPKFFDDDFIKLKKIQSKIKLVDLNYEDAIEIISSTTRFSKKICLIDPNIPYDITTINLQTRGEKNISKVELNKNWSANDYIIGLQEFIKNIYNNNFFKEELKIYIITTINPGKIKRLKESLTYKLKDPKINRVELEKDLESWKNLSKTVCDCIKHHTCKLIENFEPEIEVKKHWMKDKNELKLNDKKQDLYDRFVYCIDIQACLEVRKGLDIFLKKNKLRKETSNFLRVVIDSDEKAQAMLIFSHPKYEAEKISQIL